MCIELHPEKGTLCHGRHPISGEYFTQEWKKFYKTRRLYTAGLTAEQCRIVDRLAAEQKWDVVFHDDEISGDFFAFTVFAAVINPEVINMDIEEIVEACGFGQKCLVFTSSVEWKGDRHAVGTDVVMMDEKKDFGEQISKILLGAHKKKEKNYYFSRKLDYCFRVLKWIKQEPGIKTAEIAKRLEVPNRSALRYIEILRLSGEFIIYCPQKRGWQDRYYDI